MLEYTECSPLHETSTQIEDVLIDVVTDLRGVSLTLWSLSQAPGDIEAEQAAMLGDVVSFAQEALEDLATTIRAKQA